MNAVRVLVLPAQILVGLAVIVTTGKGFTVIVLTVVLVQPATLVPVTV